MRTFYKSLFITIASTIVFSSIVVSQTTQENFATRGDLRWEASSTKEFYLPLEPLQIKFRVTNTSNLPTNRSAAVIFVLYVTHSGRTAKFEQIFPVPYGRLFIGTINHGESKDLNHIFDIDLAKIFPEYGRYDLVFAMPYSDKNDQKVKEISTNIFSINIVPPTGIDKEAFDFLNKYDNSRFLRGLAEEKNSEPLFRAFVERFGQSVYWDYVVENLASLYSSNNDWDRAEIEYEKIKGSRNPVIAKRVKTYLSAVKRRKESREKMNQPNRPQ